MSLHEALTAALAQHAANAAKAYLETIHEIAEGAPKDIAVGMIVENLVLSHFDLPKLPVRIRLTAGERTVTERVELNPYADGKDMVTAIWTVVSEMMFRLVPKDQLKLKQHVEMS